MGYAGQNMMSGPEDNGKGLVPFIIAIIIISIFIIYYCHGK